MTINYTTLLGFAQPVPGTEANTWGTVVNDSITELVEDAIAGSATASVTSADWTLTTTGSGAANQARSAILIPTGTPGVSRNIIAPSSSKAYIVDNQSNAAVVIKGSATTGATIAAGTAALVAWDGTDFVLVSQDLANASGTLPVTKGGTGATTLTGVVKGTGTSALTAGTVNLASEVTGTLPVANGGTGATTLTANNVILGNGTSAVQVVAPGTTGNVLTSNGTTWTSSALPNVGDVDGPASATDNAVARYDGTTGKIIQNSAVTIDDDGNTVISTNSSTNALRITQVGTGNALLVEDSANPDATPFVIDANGNVVSGKTSAQAVGSATPQFQLHSTTASPIWDSYANFNWAASGQSAGLVLAKSKSGVIGTFGSVASNDNLGQVWFYGDDNSAFIPGASITAAVDGTPGTNDMPGRVVISTTPDGGSSPLERVRIASTGNVGIGGTPGTDSLGVYKNLTGSINGFHVAANYTIQSDVTAAANSFTSFPTTAASAFTLAGLRHFYAWGRTFGAGSTVTNQFGFHAESTLTSATNNFGFYSNIANGTGRWNFYAAGTARNYMAGALSIGNTTDPGVGGISINGAIMERVFTITDGAAFEIDPGNGTIQLITLGASRTPKATNFAAGESITLMVDDGSAYTLTWTDATFGGSGVIWETDGGSAPTLSTSGYTTIVLWKVSTQVYGARVGNA